MIRKAPGDTYNYTVEWSAELGVDTINATTWTAEAPLTLDGFGHNAATQTTFDVSANGEAGVTYKINGEITTVGGDTFKKTIYCKVQEQIAG